MIFRKSCEILQLFIFLNRLYSKNTYRRGLYGKKNGSHIVVFTIYSSFFSTNYKLLHFGSMLRVIVEKSRDGSYFFIISIKAKIKKDEIQYLYNGKVASN